MKRFAAFLLPAFGKVDCILKKIREISAFVWRFLKCPVLKREGKEREIFRLEVAKHIFLDYPHKTGKTQLSKRLIVGKT